MTEEGWLTCEDVSRMLRFIAQKRPALQKEYIVVVWATIPWCVAAAWPHHRWVAIAQVPYLVWVSLATAVQLSIVATNG